MSGRLSALLALLRTPWCCRTLESTDTRTNPKKTIVVRADLGMRKGKIGAQAGHACEWGTIADFTSGKPLTRCQQQYYDVRFRKVCLKVNSEAELVAIYDKAVAAGLPVKMVTDSGLTEFHGVPTKTCLAIGPCYDDDVDPITGSLYLYLY